MNKTVRFYLSAVKDTLIPNHFSRKYCCLGRHHWHPCTGTIENHVFYEFSAYESWLKHSCEPWLKVIDLWGTTAPLRFQEFCWSGNVSIAQIQKEWPWNNSETVWDGRLMSTVSPIGEAGIWFINSNSAATQLSPNISVIWQLPMMSWCKSANDQCSQHNIILLGFELF